MRVGTATKQSTLQRRPGGMEDELMVQIPSAYVRETCMSPKEVELPPKKKRENIYQKQTNKHLITIVE